jgi:hypothetical protein
MTRGAARELFELVGELGARPAHPAWLALVAGTAILERLARLAPDAVEGDPYTTYLAANGSPRSDTFMARARPARRLDAAGRIALAVVRAEAALAAIARLDGTLPGQPLARALRFERGWLRRVALNAGAPVVFITPSGRVAADPSSPEDCARALGQACARGARLDGAPVAAAAVAVDLSPQPAGTARHLHRRAWSDAGGPWLGVGETDALEIVTTCHLAVDGYGHGRLADGVFHAVDAVTSDRLARLSRAARAGLGDAEPSFDEAPAIAGAVALGFASRVVPRDEIVFARVAYAVGRALARLTPGRGGAPTFQVTVAPGKRDDPDRRRRRVRFALLALGRDETFATFRARLAAVVEREREQPGLLGRVLEATARAPLPRALRRRLLASEGRPSRLVPPVEALGGRASLSLIRYPPEERPRAPLAGASSPGLVATARDPLGSFVVTIVEHEGGGTISVDGTGVAGTDEGARRVLDILLEELAAAPRR